MPNDNFHHPSMIQWKTTAKVGRHIPMFSCDGASAVLALAFCQLIATSKDSSLGLIYLIMHNSNANHRT